MTAFELSALKISSCGISFTLPTDTVFETRRSSWLIRSVNSPFERYGINCTRRFAESTVPCSVGSTSCPAGHGAGQFAGYLVVLLSSQEVPAVSRVVVSDRNAYPLLLWNAPLS